MDKFWIQWETVSMDEKWRVTGAFTCMCTNTCTLTHAKMNACILTHSPYIHVCVYIYIYMQIYMWVYVSIYKWWLKTFYLISFFNWEDLNNWKWIFAVHIHGRVSGWSIIPMGGRVVINLWNIFFYSNLCLKHTVHSWRLCVHVIYSNYWYGKGTSWNSSKVIK